MSNGNEIIVQGVPLMCKHCGAGRFDHRRSQLNTAVMTFFELDWLNASADIYCCEQCGFLHWFLGSSIRSDADADADDAPPAAALPDEPLPVDDTSLASDCLACGKAIPVGADVCPDCGWSYRSTAGAT